MNLMSGNHHSPVRCPCHREAREHQQTRDDCCGSEQDHARPLCFIGEPFLNGASNMLFMTTLINRQPLHEVMLRTVKEAFCRFRSMPGAPSVPKEIWPGVTIRGGSASKKLSYITTSKYMNHEATEQAMFRPSGPANGADVLHSLPFHFARLHFAFRALLERLRVEAGLKWEVRPGMASIFFALCEEEDCVIKRLVERLQIPNSTLTGLLDGMERQGVIERHDCPDDGRAYRVRLTAKGRALEPRLRELHRRAVETLHAGLADAEVAELKELLGRVLVNLHRKDETTPAPRPSRKAALPAVKTSLSLKRKT